MYSDNKQIRDVADVAAKIMYGQQPVTEKLHPNQQQLDVHEPEKDELTADDFKKLRAKKEVKKEEVEELDEVSLKTATSAYVKRSDKEDEEGEGKFPSKSSETMDRIHRKHGAKGVMRAATALDKEHGNFDSTGTMGQTKKQFVGNYLAGRKQSDPVMKVRKEEVEELDELSKPTLGSYVKKATGSATDAAMNLGYKAGRKEGGSEFVNTLTKRRTGIERASDKLAKEEVEQIVEYETNKDGKFVHNAKAGRYGGSEKPQDPFAGVRGPGQKDLEKIEAEKKKKQKKFSEMVNLYQEKGLKSLSEMLVKEEPDNEEFTKELEDAKAKSEGKKKNTEIAKGSVQAVKNEELDINDINGVQMSTIEERMMTEPEKEKKEDIVKGMKKGMAGFKDLYGSRANDVMYATATKQAMK